MYSLYYLFRETVKVRDSILMCAFMILLFCSVLSAQQPAFPGAEGFGKYVTGGRGGSVKIVTNLNDSGSGSLRAAIQSGGARTVVFRVSGTIALNSDLKIENGNITIAGQTAPGDGICIKNYPLVVSADNVIIRYLRSRLGDDSQEVDDAMNGRNHKNIIIDHCSMSWSVDETASFYDNENFTMQWCIISESLYRSVHEKGDHGYGGIWGGKGATFHHNLLAHHTSRNPRFCGSRYSARPDLEKIDHRNNVIYNWGGNSCYGAEGGSYNIVYNYYKSGPATSVSVKNRIINPWADGGSNSQPAGVMGIFYIDANYVHGYPDITADNWNGGVQGVIGDPENIRAYEPFPVPSVVTQTAENAFLSVLAEAGAVKPIRDIVDARIVDEAFNGTAHYGGAWGENEGIIDTQSEVGGWPALLTYDVPTDNDNDGMADEWEDANGLDPSNASDRNNIAANGYTNLENYLNSLTFRDDYVRAPAELTALTLSDSEIRLHWKETSSDETGFKIERSNTDTTSFAEVIIVNSDDTTYTDSDLSPATRYFYRVCAVKNEVQSFYTNLANDKTIYDDGRPLAPVNPFPEDNADDIQVAVVLTWENGNAATSYDVYFGTTNPPTESMGNQVETYFDPRGLADSSTYFWRVDAINSSGTTTGDVWQFTTETFTEAVNAYWDFNRGFGSLVQDASGNGNSAYLKNMLPDNWVDDGVISSAMKFDGVDDYLQVYDKTYIDFTIRGFSINFWLKQSQNDVKMFWLSKADYENETFSTRYELFSDENDQVNFTVADSDHSSTLSVFHAGFFGTEWVMVTAIRDDTDKKLKIYLNDEFIFAVDDSTYNISNTGDLLIGTNAALSDFFLGQIDELRIYNYALDESEISTLYQEVTNIADQVQIPRKLELANYPNPFNNNTLITYTIPKSSQVILSVYNILGQKVDTLVKEKKAAGTYKLNYNPRNLSSGIYIFRLQADNKSAIKKIVLIK